MSAVAASPREFCAGLTRDLVITAPAPLVGVYLHGSAVLGDWDPRASDIDVLVIIDEYSTAIAARLAAVLGARRDCPGRGVEVSLVEAHAAAAPTAPWPFVVHVTTAPDDRKTVWGNPSRGDPDLILHYLVTRSFGWAAYGPAPAMVIGPVGHDVVLGQLATELRWAIKHAPESFAVLNACRARRYRDEQIVCSKSDGGRWALAQHLQPALVHRALDDRLRGVARPVTEVAAAFVLAIADDLG
jgi:hypothetical protein